ncbi:hypothetical protein GCM10027341_20690 [Spirosoma knui]
MKKAVLFVVYVLISSTIQAQQPTLPLAKLVLEQEQAWLGYFNQTRFNTHWGIWTDIRHRRTDFLDRLNQNLFRAGLTYYVVDNLRLTAGYAYAGSALSPSGTIRPERRPWQQVWWAGRFNLLQWIRAGQRFNHRVQGDQLADGYSFNWRFRYNFMLQIPFNGETIQPGIPNFVIQNEFFINAGKQITYNYFDQNRFFVGLSYPQESDGAAWLHEPVCSATVGQCIYQ